MTHPVNNHPILDHFSDLLAVPSPSGYEKAVAEVIRVKINTMGFTPETDQSGNVLVRLTGRNPDLPRHYYASHMDEIGMVVTHIEADGKLAVMRSGGLFPFKIGERPALILGDVETITGIVSMGSTHGEVGTEVGRSWDSVKLITGLSPAQLKQAGVRVGTPAVPAREGCGPVIFGEVDDPLVGAWTFDDKMGCAVLLTLLQHLRETNSEPAAPTVIAFTVSEELGGHGAKGLCQREKPDIFVAVDGLPIAPGSPLKIDGRPVICTKDKLATYDVDLIQAFMTAAKQAGTELQPAISAGASDASMVYSVGAAARVANFGHVRENSHGYEVARLSVFDNTLQTLIHFMDVAVL